MSEECWKHNDIFSNQLFNIHFLTFNYSQSNFLITAVDFVVPFGQIVVALVDFPFVGQTVDALVGSPFVGQIVAALVGSPFVGQIVAAHQSFVVTVVVLDLQLDSFELMHDYFECIEMLDLKFELPVG